MNDIEFQDQIHLEKIRADLWCGREYGRAAVMIGAGFSRNAEPLSPSTPAFPLLRQVATTLYERLYPTRAPLTRNEEIKAAQATTGSGVLKLAREYEAEFGRPALDELMLKAIPDENYIPGRLHRLLLSLPWSDVFTTNYDTLLERGRAAVHDRKYDLIQTTHDIPGRMKPRIVKLHGSFPSHRPFIVTEDDYRTYPTHFAPFVNMVQQSIMENSFCLVGFSGDDPNFLYWSGWVRDNLKEATPTIYLCGLLNLSAAARKVLQARRVIPIDLSPLFPVSVWPDANVRHSKALEWLLLNLMRGASPDLKRWPAAPDNLVEEPSPGLPRIPAGPMPLSGNGPHFPKPQEFKVEDLIPLRKIWTLNRREYPGWAVAPKENRDRIWNFTMFWIDTVFANVGGVSFPDNLFLLYELNWRLELTLTPLFMPQVEKIAAVLNEINPFPHLVEIAGAKFRPDDNTEREVDWTEVSRCWVELTFALAREAREDLDQKRFRGWMDRLKPVIPKQSETEARWHYEEALFSLFRLDQNALSKALATWPPAHDLPFWESKRAALLAELGKTEEAGRIAEEALSKVRSRLQAYRVDHALLSQEGFIMMLLRGIQANVRPFQANWESFRARWDKLDGFGCNPWREIELFRLALGASSPKVVPPTESRIGFDPGRSTVTHHTSPGIQMQKLAPAIGLLRLCDEGGIPFRCGIVNVCSDEVANAAKWVAPFAPLWSLSVLLRAGEDKWIDENYDRVRMATMPQDGVDAIFALCYEGLSQSVEREPANGKGGEGSLSDQLIRTLSEMLSRLTFRLDEQRRSVVFDLGLRMFRRGVTRGDFRLLEHVPAVLKRSLFSMNAGELLRRIPTLLSLPIPGEPGVPPIQFSTLVAEVFDWLMLSTRIQGSPPPGADWSAPILHLISLTTKGHDGLVRAKAAWRLGGLYRCGLLARKQEADFAEALWSETDATTRLPANTNFFGFAFLDLPEVNPGTAKSLIRAFLLESEVPRVFSRTRLPDGTKRKSFTPGERENRYIRELLGATKPLFPTARQETALIDWSLTEAILLLAKLESWWREEKPELRPIKCGKFFDPGEQIEAQFEGIVEVMAKAVLPALKDADGADKERARALLSEMEQCGFITLHALPAFLFLNPQSSDEVASKLRSGLISNSEGDVREAMAGLFLWLARSTRKQIPAPPGDLLATVVNKVKTRSQPALVSALAQLAEIFRHLPSTLNEDHIAELSIGLDYLHSETKLTGTSGVGEPGAKRSIPVAELPLYREYASALAARIYFWCLGAGSPVPPAISAWKEAATADVLPEVRHHWDSVDHSAPN